MASRSPWAARSQKPCAERWSRAQITPPGAPRTPGNWRRSWRGRKVNNGETMLRIVPLELKEANALVKKWHRHHQPVIGHRFSIGAYDTNAARLVGAAIVGRPVARHINWRVVVEITRLVTDGTPNACSLLYAAGARIAREMGYQQIQTYILDTEPGT